jgi:hypothetical protein
MLKNIERKQKLQDERQQVKPLVSSSQLLFSSQFIKEITEMVQLQEPNRVQYAATTRKHKGPPMLESIINMMSRVVDESGMVASRIDT